MRGWGREACPEEESDEGRERENILGMCKGPAEGVWPAQEMGRLQEVGRVT